MMNVWRMAAPTPPGLGVWKGRGLQTPTGPMHHAFGSSTSLQEELVQLPNTSRSLQTSLQEEFLQLPNTSGSLQTAYMQPMSRSPRAQNATDNLVHNAAHTSTKQIN